jgi:hypothetical protein
MRTKADILRGRSLPISKVYLLNELADLSAKEDNGLPTNPTMERRSIDFNHPIFQKASTCAEIGEFLGTDEKFLFREISRGNLRDRKFNARMLRILPQDLIAWLERAQTTQQEVT